MGSIRLMARISLSSSLQIQNGTKSVITYHYSLTWTLEIIIHIHYFFY